MKRFNIFYISLELINVPNKCVNFVLIRDLTFMIDCHSVCNGPKA